MSPRTDTTTPPLKLGEDTQLRLSLRTLMGILAISSAALLAYYNLKADIAYHSQQLAIIQGAINSDHDQITKSAGILESLGKSVDKIDKKLDYMMTRNHYAGGTEGSNR